MPEQSIVIKFQAKGNERLTLAINKLDDATRELRGETTRLRKQGGLLDTQFKRNQKSAGALAGAFSTMRSKMLLVNFAMSLGIRQLVKFSEESTKVDNMEKAFIKLTGAVGDMSGGLEQLQQATNGTVSDFDLLQQANNAMILGVTDNTDEMAEMFDVAQRLGRALGRDTKSSVESLITGIGRQSRLMLDNIGIIVKSEQAYKKDAQILGITADKLTDSQKKQAFLNAAMDAANKKVMELGKEVPNVTDSFDRFAVNANKLAMIIGTKLQPPLQSILDFGNDFMEIFTGENNPSQKINELGLGWEALGAAFMSSIPGLQLVNDALRIFKNETTSIQGDPNSMLRTDGNPLVLMSENLDKIAKSIKDREFRGNINFISEFLNNVDAPAPKSIANAVKLITEEAKLAQISIDAISSSLASAAINGKHMGKSVEDALKQIAAQIISKAAVFSLFSILSGGTAAGAFRFALGLPTAHTGGLIEDNKVQKFATGGVVEGQDNVPILAQNGEFVMSRSAVESVGIETMNRINQTGSAGVTVNVSGNVMSQDFVEGELAERIKEAVRKGSNFGMS